MVYKLKKPRDFNEEETARLRRKHHGHPSMYELVKVGADEGLNEPRIVHQKNSIVEYKGELAIVEKVNKKGIYIKRLKIDKKDDFAVPSKKNIFISDSRVDNEIRPAFYPNLSLGTFAPYNMGYMKY